MHVRRVTAATTALAAVTLALLTVPGSAQVRQDLPSPATLPVAHAGPVTALVRPLADYVAAGLAPRDVARRVLLDRLAAQGVSLPLLRHVDAAATADQPSEYVDLLAAGDLDGKGGRDVLEERLVSGKSETLRLLARDGRTGRVLWRRTLGVSGLTFAVPAQVAAGGRAGVLLIAFGGFFEEDGSTVQLTGLDGAGRTRWTRAVSHRSAQAPAPTLGVGPDSATGTFDTLSVWIDQPLRSGLDVAVFTESASYSSDGLTTSIASSAWLEAVDERTGALRTLVPSVSSTTGIVGVNLLPDVDGDGRKEVAVVEGGDAQRVRVLRAADGKAVWTRTDLPVHQAGFLAGAGSVLGSRAAGRPVDDLAFVGDVDPGVLSRLPAQPPVDDPTRGAHGSVALLRGTTGTTAWTRSGDGFVVLGRAGVPALGVVTFEESTSATRDSASVTLDAVDTAGKVRWERAETAAVDHGPDDFTFTGGFAIPVGDLDGDKGVEVVLFAYAYDTDTEVASSHLLGSRDGAAVKDQTSAVLYGGTTSAGFDRWTQTSTAAGPRFTVTSGRDGRRLLTTVVPASRSTAISSAYAEVLRSSSRHDVLVVAKDSKTTVVAVIGPDGRRLWMVSRATASAGDGTLRR